MFARSQVRGLPSEEEVVASTTWSGCDRNASVVGRMKRSWSGIVRGRGLSRRCWNRRHRAEGADRSPVVMVSSAEAFDLVDSLPWLYRGWKAGGGGGRSVGGGIRGIEQSASSAHGTAVKSGICRTRMMVSTSGRGNWCLTKAVATTGPPVHPRSAGLACSNLVDDPGRLLINQHVAASTRPMPDVRDNARNG